MDGCRAQRLRAVLSDWSSLGGGDFQAGYFVISQKSIELILQGQAFQSTQPPERGAEAMSGRLCLNYKEK